MVTSCKGRLTNCSTSCRISYRLAYPPSAIRHDDNWHRITVDVEGRYDVRARQGYRASSRK